MSKTLTPTVLFNDTRLLVILFVSFRLVMLIGYQPFLLNGVERGVGVGGDRAYHYALTAQIADDLLPFRDWWSEFPPVWYLTTGAVYSLLGRGATYDSWSLVLGMLVVLAETGTLLTVRNLGIRLHGAAVGQALTWIYALMIAPVIFMWWNFDSLVTFFTLLALWLLLIGKDARASGLVALGALTKFISFLLFGALVRFYPLRRAIRIIVVAIGLFGLAYVPLLAINSTFAMISLTAQFNKPSYQTVWALLDGNYGTGNFGTVASHLTAQGVQDGVADKNAAVIPGVVRLIGAALIGLWVYSRVRRFDQLGVVAFFGVTLLIFYLQSQGWSPQWLTLIIPLILLVLPTRDGVLLCVMLTVLAFVEYPYIFVRTAETAGQVLPDHPLFAVWVIVVILRTLVLVAVAALFYGRLRQQPNPDLSLG